MIAAQTGETQWALHPEQADAKGLTLPVATDSGPFAGSSLDRVATPKLPYGPEVSWLKPQRRADLRHAAALASWVPRSGTSVAAADQDAAAGPAGRAAGPRRHRAPRQRRSLGLVSAGFRRRAVRQHRDAGRRRRIRRTAPTSCTTTGRSISAISADNPQAWLHLHGLQDFFADVAAASAAGGRRRVLRARRLLQQRRPDHARSQPASCASGFAGNDDHPGYADRRFPRRMVADAVNAIAASPLLGVRAPSSSPMTRPTDSMTTTRRMCGARGPDGTAADRWPAHSGDRRLALRGGAYGRTCLREHSSVIRFINALFNLVPLADLPDELRGRERGRRPAGAGSRSARPTTLSAR